MKLKEVLAIKYELSLSPEQLERFRAAVDLFAEGKAILEDTQGQDTECEEAEIKLPEDEEDEDADLDIEAIRRELEYV